jgi:drug/metabolite transporter (DMT)-like permease
MSSWILIAILAYLLFAINGIIDKILLTKAVRNPLVYVFFNGTLAPFVLIFLPFGVHPLGLNNTIIALIGGACFTIALYFYYTSIQAISISRVLPIQGGFVPLFTLILASFLVSERLSSEQLIAFIFLTSGAVLISFKKSEGTWHIPGLGFSLIAALLFAMHFVLSKYIYDQADFINGLFWTRWGMFLIALTTLLSAKNRKEIWSARSETSNQQKIAFYTSRGAGGLAGVLQNFAISIGSVTIVNALQSVQFSFVLILTTFLSFKYPKLLKEAITANIILQKLAAICLVIVGLIILGRA